MRENEPDTIPTLKVVTLITAVVGLITAAAVDLITVVAGPHIQVRLRVELGKLHQIPNIASDRRSTLAVHTTVQLILLINLEPEVQKPNRAILLQGIMDCVRDSNIFGKLTLPQNLKTRILSCQRWKR